MRKMGDLMKELGFREGASDDVKIAFIKNLAKAAYGVELAGPGEVAKPTSQVASVRSANQQEHKPVKTGEGGQLSFDFVDAPDSLSVETPRKSG